MNNELVNTVSGWVIERMAEVEARGKKTVAIVIHERVWKSIGSTITHLWGVPLEKAGKDSVFIIAVKIEECSSS